MSNIVNAIKMLCAKTISLQIKLLSVTLNIINNSNDVPVSACCTDVGSEAFCNIISKAL